MKLVNLIHQSRRKVHDISTYSDSVCKEHRDYLVVQHNILLTNSIEKESYKAVLAVYLAKRCIINEVASFDYATCFNTLLEST